MITLNPSGEQLKREALTLLEANREPLLIQARRRLLAHLFEHGEATADDARRGLEIPANVNPKCLGSVPGLLARQGIIRRKAYRPSQRSVAHARPNSVWEMTNPVKARAWLDTHPEPTPPANVQGELPLNEKPRGGNPSAND